jgi:hypothetical protein
VRLSYDPVRISARFDDPNLVSRAGLVPVMGLAEWASLAALVRGHVAIAAKAGVFPEVKAGCLVAGMAAGADSIDDVGLLRRGAMTEVFDGRASANPSSATNSDKPQNTRAASQARRPPAPASRRRHVQSRK